VIEIHNDNMRLTVATRSWPRLDTASTPRRMVPPHGPSHGALADCSTRDQAITALTVAKFLATGQEARFPRASCRGAARQAR
jgi:hypothetical protein